LDSARFRGSANIPWPVTGVKMKEFAVLGYFDEQNSGFTVPTLPGKNLHVFQSSIPIYNATCPVIVGTES
jgi:hypothetical protein